MFVIPTYEHITMGTICKFVLVTSAPWGNQFYTINLYENLN